MLRLFVSVTSAILLAACGPGTASDSVSSAPAGADSLSILRLDPGLDSLIAPDARIEVLAEGFAWSEGPLWVPEEGGYLLFSDIPPNRVMRWSEAGGLSRYLFPAGSADSTREGGEPGSNGLLLDEAGRLVLCQHGDRQVARMAAPLSDPAPRFVSLASHFEGKRLNSPNDAVFDRQGRLYFTDPPYGLPNGPGDPAQELSFQGVFRLDPDGQLYLLVDSLTRPNGIGLSPDERTLYVAVSDPERARIHAFQLNGVGEVDGGSLLVDLTAEGAKPGSKGLPDGLVVAPNGILYATGPGGVWVLTPEGKALGQIRTGQATANCTIGGDGYLYMTAHMYLMRVRLR
ncbi:MAG: SMP-30/gluconolactonase/LRE family protein [Bacteroidetes bacterium]|nr:MAG: SMP-30/gluconolactonase/LRE family protein [Bacteroidota bacterium]